MCMYISFFLILGEPGYPGIKGDKGDRGYPGKKTINYYIFKYY